MSDSTDFRYETNRLLRIRKPYVVATLCLLAAGLTPFAASADPCADASAKAKRERIIIPGYLSGHKITGKGRAYFYAHPSDSCREKDTFVIPGDQLIAYETYKDFTYVMYIHPRTGVDTSGWIKSNRLESTGTGIAPNQNEKP